MYENSNFSTSSTFVIDCLFYYGHASGYEVVYLCGFRFAFSWWLMMLDTSSYTYWAFVYFRDNFIHFSKKIESLLVYFNCHLILIDFFFKRTVLDSHKIERRVQRVSVYFLSPYKHSLLCYTTCISGINST